MNATRNEHENIRHLRLADSEFSQGNFSNARAKYEQLSEAGDERAMSVLGHMFENGHGVEKDLDIAEKWYRRSMEHGFSTASFFLARLLAKQDRKLEAFNILDEMAHLGNVDHLLEYAHYLEHGIGCEKNIEKARHYFVHVANSGDYRAKRWLQLDKLRRAETYFDIFTGFFGYLWFELLIRLLRRAPWENSYNS